MHKDRNGGAKMGTGTSRILNDITEIVKGIPMQVRPKN